MKCALAWFATLAALATVAMGETFELREDFGRYKDGPPPPAAWRTTGFSWEVRKGKLTCEESGKTFAILAKAPHGRRVVVEATLTAERAVGKEWKVAGVCVYRDGRNYWHLAMAESPTNAGQAPKHTWELIECLGGAWLANFQGDGALPEWGQATAGTWQYGAAYRLRLELSPEGVRGTVTDANGKLVWRRGHRFAKGRAAVKAGAPALDCGDFRASFDDVKVTVADAVAPPASQRPPSFAAYDRPAMSDIRAKATGFFRVERIDGTWWLIDPKGFAFYGLGTDHIRYDGHWCEKLGYAPYGRNMRAKFPKESDWCAETIGRLRAWGFNTLAAGHSPSLRHRGLVHTEFISFGARFSSFSDITPKVHWTGFPNVFHPRWPAFCRKLAEESCRRQRSDPWLLGYFLDNELEWYGKKYGEFGLVAEAWAKPPEHTAKRALVALLKRRHGTIAKLNAAWAKFASFDALAGSTTMPPAETPAAAADRYAYLALVAEKYFDACCRAIRAADPNHMILGSRFAGRVHDCVWRAAGKHLDVVTVNQYPRVKIEAATCTAAREELEANFRLCRRPMILTEWSFPALDSGLPCTKGAGMRVDTQAQRAECFRIYQTMLFSLPFMVGSHFFMWVDEPALGIASTFPENSNYGLVSEKGKPYPELTAACARLNPRAVGFHRGRTAEIVVRIDPAKKQAVLSNAGKLAADVPVDLWLDGRRQSRTVRLPEGGTAKLDIPGGTRWAVVRADADRTLAEADRSDNVAAAALPAKASAGAVAAMCVGNPTARTLTNVIVRVPIDSLVRAHGADGRATAPHQITDGPRGKVLAVLLERIGPFGSVAMELRPDDRGRAIKAALIRGQFDRNNGTIMLRKTDKDGDLLDDVVLGGVRLGRVQAMVHQNIGQDLWLPANALGEVRMFAGHIETVFEFTAEYRPGKPAEVKTTVDDEGKFAARRAPGRAWRGRWQIRIAKGQGFFELRCLSVTNIDKHPWKLVSYFHYLPSHIGGSPAGDAPAAGDVPNYYGLRTVWADAKAGAAYGAVVPAPLEGNFWLNPSGGQHPDIRRKIDVVLEPGRTWAAPPDEPAVWVFGARGPAENRPWRGVADGLKARAEVSVKVWPTR